MDGATLYEVSFFFLRSLVRGAINIRSSAISYNFFLALFPGIIFLFTLVPFVLQSLPYLPQDQDYVNYMMNQIKLWLPKNAYEISQETILDIISQPRQGLLSLSFFLTILFATNGFNSLITSFNQSIHIELTRSFIKQRFVAFLLLFIITTLFITTIALAIFSNVGYDYLIKNGWIVKNFSFYALTILNWVMIVALVYLSIAFMYYLAPATDARFRFLSAGSSLATFLVLLSSFLFTWYINNFGQYNKLYGSIGALIVIMIWLNIIATVLLIGFELDASIVASKRKNKSIEEIINTKIETEKAS